LGCRRVRACATGCVVKARPCDGIARPAWAVHAPNHAACDRDEFECEEEDEPGDSRAVVTLERCNKSPFPHYRRPTSNVAAVPAGGGHVFVVGDTCRSRHARQPPTALSSTVPTLPGRTGHPTPHHNSSIITIIIPPWALRENGAEKRPVGSFWIPGVLGRVGTGV